MFILISFFISVYSSDYKPGLYLKDEKWIACTSGYYCPGDGNKYECPDGTYSNEYARSLNQCRECGCKNMKSCQKGTITISNIFGNKTIHAGHCKGLFPCKSGFGFAKEEHSCHKCPQKFISSGGKSVCEPCKENAYTNEKQTKCIECPFGKVYDLIENQCEGCPTGKYFNKETKSCNYCPEGYYNDKPHQTECKKCPDGLYTNEMRNGCTTESLTDYWINNNYYQTELEEYQEMERMLKKLKKN